MTYTTNINPEQDPRLRQLPEVIERANRLSNAWASGRHSVAIATASIETIPKVAEPMPEPEPQLLPAEPDRLVAEQPRATITPINGFDREKQVRDSQAQVRAALKDAA